MTKPIKTDRTWKPGDLVHYQRITGPSSVRVHPANADSFYMALYNASVVCCQ